MALFRYLRPIDSALNPQGPLSHSVPRVVISEVNREVKKAEMWTKKQGSYLSFTAEEKQTIMRAMCDNGAVVNTSITVATATGVVWKRDKSLLVENGGSLELAKNWAKSILYRIGFVKRRGNTKAKVSVEHFEALKSQFLFDIQATVEMQEIPPELVVNWDQTGIKIIPVSSWTMEKEVQSESRSHGWTTNSKSLPYLL